MKKENSFTLLSLSGDDPTIHEKVEVSTYRKRQIDIYIMDSGSEAGMTAKGWLFS